MNSTNYKPVLFAFILLFITVASRAQQHTVPDSMNSRIKLYGVKNQSPVLFIHFDKNVYSNNDKVWFTAYLLNADYPKYNLLSLTLVRDYDRFVVLENKFMIKSGLVFGNTVIPNAVLPGNYSFIATTNRMVNGRPEVVFTQPITVRTEDQQEFTASLAPVDTSVALAVQKVMLSVNFINEQIVAGVKSKTPPPAAVISYYVGNTAKPVIRGFGKTKENEYLFTIPSKLLSPGNNWLHVQLQYKKDVKEVNMALPVAPRPATVRFYPEGGNMVNNIPCTVGWEVKNAAGKPLEVNALLYQDKKVIDTLSTDGYGFGKFILKPKKGSSYEVKLYAVNKQDTLYQLPAALTQGPVLSVPHGVINDTLLVDLKDELKEKLYLIGHNYKQLFFITPVHMTSLSKRIRLIMKDIPKGLTQLTLTDSTGRPFAERVFFAHYNQRAPLNVTTDKNEYATRQKINVKVRLNTTQPDEGFVSIACVQENRIEIKKKDDIESFLYLKHDLGDLPLRETYLNDNEADRQFLENILLIKNWRRYTWTDMLKTKPADTLHRYTNPALKGTITQYNQPLTKPVILTNVSHPLDKITTSATGAFTLTNTDLLTDSGSKANFMVSDPKSQTYTIRLADPYTVINELLAAQLEPKDYTAAGQENSKYMQVPNNEHAIHLKEVNINGNNDNSFFGMSGRNIPGSHLVGYDVFLKDATTSVMVYETDGPREFMLQLNGIYAVKEFYASDYSKTPEEPEYLSTLYWKNLVKVSSVTDTEFSFYTGDITGKFKIVIQGITGNNVTYGETTFNVIKPQ
jgi:hypothetical protein